MINGTQDEWGAQTLINSTLNDIEVTYSITSTDGICIENFNYTVIVRANPRIENNNIINLCSGDALEYTLEVDPGVSVVSWSRTDTNLVSGTSQNLYDNQLFNSTSNIVNYTYEVIVQNADGCNSTEIISVNVNPIPVVNNLTNGIEICSGSLFNFNPTSNVTNAQISWQRLSSFLIKGMPGKECI